MTHEKIKGFESGPAAQFFSYSVPAIIGMLLTSGIIIVDGLFIGNFIGETGLAAVNLTLPLLYLFLGAAIMTGVGGSVKTAHALGAGNRLDADRHFSFTIILTVVIIGALTLLSALFFDTILGLMTDIPGLKESLSVYLGTILWFYPAIMISIVFSIFIRTQGNPVLSLFFGIAGNSLNLALDYFMIVRWGMGLRGAALASGISVIVPMTLGFFYFMSGKSFLSFTPVSIKMDRILSTLFNGSSEMVGQLSIGITTWLFNRIILSRLGVDGVAAYTIVGYAAFVQMMIITGFATGLGPIIGVYYGAGKGHQIRSVMNIALLSGFCTGLICWTGVVLFSGSIAGGFSANNPQIIAIAGKSFVLFTAAFLFNGFNILSTAYFTAIGDAATSAVIALLRGLVLINILVLLLPRIIGDTGIWLSYPLSELITLGAVIFYYRKSCRDLPQLSGNERLKHLEGTGH